MSSNLFALPVGTWQAARPIGAPPRLTGKRKRNPHGTPGRDDVETLDAERSEAHGGTSLNANHGSRRPPILTPDDIYQYSVAGQPQDDHLPANNFPHASGRVPRSKLKNTFLEGNTKDPFTTARSSRITLKQQHLAVITAILHRCIVERDFNRASRALGLILRDEHNGHPVDIRTHGRWGIGAEILLRKGQSQYDTSTPVITRSGFELARRYYERLAIEHPFVRNYPNAFDERDFYLALLGLWIYVAHEDAKRIRETANDHEDNRDASETIDLSSGYQNELAEARQIAHRMDDLMISPLYSQNTEFMRLRAMVALWLADLSREVEEMEHDRTSDDSMKTRDDDFGDSSMTENTSDIDAVLEGPRTPNRKGRPNLEAMQSQARAAELFARLEERLGISKTDDE